jgi:2-dehydropantoate 2-reductase
MNTQEPPLLIVGTGAMASLFAARLVRAGVRILMLGSWQDGIRALRSRGVHLVDLDGQETSYPVHVNEDAFECLGVQYALVLVKSWQTSRAARQLAACLEPQGLALTLQNGLGNREILAEALGEERVALGVTTAGANLIEPGRVRLAGNGSILLGAHPRVEPLADVLRTAGFHVEIIPDTNALVWGKLAINAAINPLTALLQVPNGELLERPTAQALMGSAAAEAAAVAAARGVQLPYGDPPAEAEEVARRTSANYSSMLRDIQRGAPTEIDAISGAIVRAGEQAQVPTPVNRTLWQLVKALANGANNGVDLPANGREIQRGPVEDKKNGNH